VSERPAELVTLTIDGKEITVPAGTLIIRAAEQLGIEIPRFCEHPFLDPVGACRQCYVEVEGQRKLFTACTTPVAPGMAVRTQNTSELARQGQVANLEFLLINHPLDCPVCDRGGECPLQDQALAFGPGESRFIEAKRTFPKPVPLSPLVLLDRERCVLCTRCTRFCDEISGDRFIEMFARGAGQNVAIAAGEDFRSPFSGNTIQICPVGALTATTYRFVARPFDLSSADTVCPHCSAGCNLRVDVRRGAVVRQLARDNVLVNDAWACDKGRFAFRWPDARDRVTTPFLREHGLEPASFAEAFDRIAGWTEGRRVGILAGGRLTDEDAYALSKLARTVFRTNDLDHRREDGGAAEVVAAAAPLAVTYRDVERARVILVVGLDAEQEVPILHLRIRKAVRKGGARVFVLHPRRTRLWDVGEHLLCLPGEEAWLLDHLGEDGRTTRLAAALAEAGPQAVVLAGARLGAAGAEAALRLARRTGARFAYVQRRAGDRGALRAGVHPRLLPGGRRVTDAAERAEVEAVWGPLPPEPGRDWRGILEAAARRELDVLFLVGVDPLRDYPDAALALRALENVRVKVVVDPRLDPALEAFADCVLPAAPFVEKDGHFTDWEGRAQRLRPARDPLGLARPDWEIFVGLAAACGGDLGFDTLEALREEAGPLLEPREAPEVPLEAPAAACPEPGDGLLLFTYALLVDEGRLVDDAPELKATLAEGAFVEVHPADAARLGLEDGGRAVVRTAAGGAELPVRVTPHVAEGAAFVPFNSPGLRAGVLLSGGFRTTAAIEPAGAREAAAIGEGGQG